MEGGGKPFPLELYEEVLLQASPKELTSLCFTSSLYYQACSTPAFWRRKFHKDNLPLPTYRPEIPAFWIEAYSEAIKAKELARETLQRLNQRPLYIDLAPLLSIQFLKVGNVDVNFIYRVWLQTPYTVPLEESFLETEDPEEKEWIVDELAHYYGSSPRLRLEREKEGYELWIYYKNADLDRIPTREYKLTLGEVEELLYHLFLDNPETWRESLSL